MLSVVLTAAGLVFVALVALYLRFRWTMRSRRPAEPGHSYVYVNNRGRARELCAEERELAARHLDPAGTPKWDPDGLNLMFRYEKVDSDEYRTGYIERRLLPPEVVIIQLTPEEDLRSSKDPVSINQAVFEDRCPRQR